MATRAPAQANFDPNLLNWCTMFVVFIANLDLHLLFITNGSCEHDEMARQGHSLGVSSTTHSNNFVEIHQKKNTKLLLLETPLSFPAYLTR